MYFPLIPRAEALDLLESAEHQAEHDSEFIAEYGFGAVSLGYSSSDALWAAQDALAQQREDFEQSEEGERYFARLAAARLYDDLAGARLSEDSIPEFIDGKPSYAHSLFGPPSTSRFAPSDDDIPF